MLGADQLSFAYPFHDFSHKYLLCDRCDDRGVRIVIHPSGRDRGKNRKTNGQEEAKEGEVHRKEVIDYADSAILGAAGLFI